MQNASLACSEPAHHSTSLWNRGICPNVFMLNIYLCNSQPKYKLL